jgi:2-polyprenyl-3-methyl-5-hydroxy-6-metoxy-1,4-benzoquinol methylase
MPHRPTSPPRGDLPCDDRPVPQSEDDSAARAADARSEVFDETRAASLAQMGEGFWWLESKAVFVEEMLRATGPAASNARLLDLGGGTGDVTAMLRDRGSSAVLAEGSEPLARHAHDEHDLPTVVATVESTPLRSNSFDVVTLLDVIEHLAEPSRALEEARRLLKAGGRVVVNVPAHAWLWSAADEFLGHHRRYTRGLLREQLESAGFEVLRVTHVFSWAVPPVWLRRRASKRSNLNDQLGVSEDSPMVARAAKALTATERRVVRRVSLPFGTSVMGVGRVA